MSGTVFRCSFKRKLGWPGNVARLFVGKNEADGNEGSKKKAITVQQEQ